MPNSTRSVYVSGIGMLPNGTHQAPERDLVTPVLTDAIDDGGVEMADIDGLYMPELRPWTPQGFFSTYLTHLLGLDLIQAVEISTGGTSSGHAFHAAVNDIRTGAIDTAVVCAVERNSRIETTGPYFEYVLKLFDHEFQAPMGVSIPGVYAQSMQRYMYEYDVSREDLAEIVVKNRQNGGENPRGLFDEPVTRDNVLSSRQIADPLHLYDCPAPCDSAAALVLTAGNDTEDTGSDPSIRIDGTGTHHAPSHLLSTRHDSVTELPAVRQAAQAASDEAETPINDIDVFEPYAPFPHIEAIITEELGLADRGSGVEACTSGQTAPDGATPISPSGGCIGRGHPPMVTPLLNYAETVAQLRGTAAVNVPDTTTAMTTAEHGHVNGVTATVFAAEGDQ